MQDFIREDASREGPRPAAHCETGTSAALRFENDFKFLPGSERRRKLHTRQTGRPHRVAEKPAYGPQDLVKDDDAGDYGVARKMAGNGRVAVADLHRVEVYLVWHRLTPSGQAPAYCRTAAAQESSGAETTACCTANSAADPDPNNPQGTRLS